MSISKFDLTGKVALVTGGNGGIGLGMASALAESGADICIWGRNETKNQAAEDVLKAYGRRTLALKCDVTDESQVRECFARTTDVLGGVDACFANAGLHRMSTPFHEMDTEEWRLIFRVNMEGTFFTLRAAVRHMLERGKGGSLVATSSLSGISAMARGEHYAASKAGVIAVIRSIAVEYARYGIRANAILPGWVESEMTGDLLAWGKFQAAVLPRVPMRRWGKPEDFGPMAVYFASDSSLYHTGDIVVIDGGYHCF
ncbi:MAG: SDR family oxidoreductase [Desulfomonile tiedjei]|uniref:SDR family oxidoreductase n=1 Tax=Desulfomonile tiedjei TaxID=2358 RepID=A0A9D6V5V3_9BACT|nr:SDR family oxidoreductase [Desulfomonile tiedjei]